MMMMMIAIAITITIAILFASIASHPGDLQLLTYTLAGI